MPDITPEKIAEIASRLYNQNPHATTAQHPSGHPQSPGLGSLHGLTLGQPAPSIPGAAANPPVPLAPYSQGLPSSSGPGGQPSSLGLHSGATSEQSLHSTPQSTSVPVQGNSPEQVHSAAHLPKGFSQEPSSALLMPQSRSSAGNDGLRSFVQKIRTSRFKSAGGLCGEERDQHLFQKMFKNPALTGGGGARPLDVTAIRGDFPALHQHVHGKPLVWLDNAATTHKPQSVIDAISHYYAHDNSNIHRAAHTLAGRSTDAYEAARQKVQNFLGASSINEIIFVRGATEGINLIAQTWGKKFLQPGDEIVLPVLEHHANIVPWQMVAKDKGAVLKVVPVNDRGEIMLEEYQSLLGPRTKLVALAHASNSLGTILPIAEMIKMAKRYNAKVLIDGAQSVAHIPVNMQELDCDFFAFSGHKIFGPTGIGVVFAKEELQQLMPPWQGGGNMIRTVSFEETSYSDPPGKFEAGTPSIADAVGLGAALDYVSALGLPNIARYEHELLEYATGRLSQIDGLRLIGTAREKVGVLSFVLPERRTEEVGKMLDAEGIAVRAGHHCAQPSLRRFGLDSTVRPSLAFYNSHDDIDRLVDTIRRIRRS